jgi:hypothetical protein
MKDNFRKYLIAAGLVVLAAVPLAVKADGLNFNVKVGDDNEAHYHFRDHGPRHNPELLKAAKSLAEAKNHLWYAQSDFGGHRTSAIQHINMALDEISAAENAWRH